MTPRCSIPLFLLSLCLSSLAYPGEHSSWRSNVVRIWRRNTDTVDRNVPPAGYNNPLDAGGEMLTSVPNTYPEGLGEPLNVILSGNSDAAVLVDQEVDGGLQNYFLSFGFSGECLGQNAGSQQAADLGDGHGFKNQTAVMRWNYGDPQLGSCRETIEGGNHFRYWIQNGKEGNSGAVFMAASVEMSIALGHDIVIDGYNMGRDEIVGNATGQFVDTPSLTNTSTFSGKTTWNGYEYQTDVVYVSGMLQNTSEGINHFLTVGVSGRTAIDGLVAVMSAKIVSRPVSAMSSSISSFQLLSSSSRTIFSLFCILTTSLFLFA